MLAADAAWRVDDEAGLVRALETLLRDEATRAALAARGVAFARGEADVLDRVMVALGPLLDPAVREAADARA
jgi:3-deoxy-D-manno-octulosonic-acid transferase